MRTPVGILFLVILTVLLHGQPSQNLLHRQYVEGDRVQYLMKGLNDGATYQVRIEGVVKKAPDGHFVEEYAWRDLVWNNAPVSLSSSAQAFRMGFTLEGGAPFSPPDLSQAPSLVGPITDLMTFYADLFLAMHGGVLQKPGDHFYFASPVLGSFADGRSVILGQSAIDFDVTLSSVDTKAGIAVLLVKHVPPPQPAIELKADWMRKPVADTPNNHVQVRKTQAGYAVSVGKETFEVELRIALADGKIVSAKMDNPVTKITRDCSDAAFTQCGDTRRDPTFRHIEMSLVKEN